MMDLSTGTQTLAFLPPTSSRRIEGLRVSMSVLAQTRALFATVRLRIMELVVAMVSFGLSRSYQRGCLRKVGRLLLLSCVAIFFCFAVWRSWKGESSPYLRAKRRSKIVAECLCVCWVEVSGGLASEVLR